MADPVEIICKLQYEDIPKNVLASARLCILDAVGCMLGGIENQAVKELARTIAERHPGSSLIAGTRLTGSRPWAAFVNTHACSYFDLDDGHRKAQGHPGGIIVPVALMLAAENRLCGRELLTAVVAGYEVAVRSAQIVREAGGPRKGSGGWAIMGAVAAAVKLSALPEDAMRNALGLAEYYAPQAPQDRSLGYPSSMKEGMAWAAHSTINIAELAEIHFDAMVPFLVDSEHYRDLGMNWEICSTYFKMYACCRFSHPVLDALAPLVEKGTHWQEIESITVKSFAKAMLLNHLAPDNPVAAMYSIPFIIGCYLVNGRVGPGEMGEESLRDARILKIAQKVKLVEDVGITEQFPLKCLARTTVTLHNGDVFKSDTLSSKGDPDNPYSKTEMIAKFLQLTRGLGAEKSDRLQQEILHIEDASPSKVWELLAATP